MKAANDAVEELAGTLPPQNEEAEAAVISAILTDARAIDAVLEFLSPEHFYGDANRRIFEAAVELHRCGQPVDLQTVASWLRDRSRLVSVGGIAYIARIINATPAVAHIEAHAQIVADKARMRETIQTCQRLASEGYKWRGDVPDYLESVESKIYAVTRTTTSTTLCNIFEVLSDEFDNMQREVPEGIQTGFTDLDGMTSGMQDGELIIIAARPGQGKTTYALDIARHVAKDRTIGVAVFSLEMPRSQLGARILCAEANVNLLTYRKRNLQPSDYDKLYEIGNDLGQRPIWIDDTAAITLLELRAKARRKKAEYERTDGRRLGLIIVDYLQLMRGDGQSREQEIAGISRGLKALAKELAVPIIALSQLNRSVEMRGKNKRPQLSDLRESGAIEQDADCVQFIYRPEYYMADKNSDEAKRAKGYAEVVVAKQRNGPTGIVHLTFLAGCTRFENRAHDAYRVVDE